MARSSLARARPPGSPNSGTGVLSCGAPSAVCAFHLLQLPCLPTESSEHHEAHCVTLVSPAKPEWHASSGGGGGGGGGSGAGGGGGGEGGAGGGGMQTAQALHLHQASQSLSLHQGEQVGLGLSPVFPVRHWPGGTGGGGDSGGGGGGGSRQKAHVAHLHQVQCTAARLGWHMAVHRRLGVSPVCAEGQVAGRSYAISAPG